MASLEKIRNRSGLLIGFIGVALAAFVLGDLFSSGDRLFGSNKQILGEINGDVIEQKDFEIDVQKRSSLQGPNANQTDLRSDMWNEKVNQILLGAEYEKSGIGITDDELAKITLGVDNHEVDPFVKQIFGIQPGQEVTSQQLSSSLNNLKKNDPIRFNSLQTLIQKQRLNNKLTTLVGSSNIATSAEAEAFYKNSGRLATGSSVFKSYASVAAENKVVTDADIKAYYESNKSDFKRKDSRRVQYAIFDIVPSSSDNAAIRSEIEKLKSTQVEFNKKFSVYDTIPGFSTEKNIGAFLREYSDLPFDASYKPKEQFSPTIRDIMDSSEVGFVYGPYFETGSYKMARLMDKRNDSLQVAILAIEVISSDETDASVFKNASAFGIALQNTSFDEASKSLTGAKVFTETITQDDRQTAGVGSDKQLMRWAFKTTRELGEITRFTLNGKYVVARLDASLPEGNASFEDMKEELRPAAEKEKAKQYLLSLVNGASSLQDASSKFGTEVKPFSGVSFSSNTIDGVGYEPVIVGAVMGLSPNTLSKPVAGINGVALVEVTAVTEPAESNDYTSIKSQLENGFIPRVNSELLSALREKAEIKDLRADFY